MSAIQHAAPPGLGPGRHVAIIGINYAPEETGNAPYTTAFAERLAARGCRVTVFTGMPYYPQWRVLDGYRGRPRIREERGGVDVRHFRTYVPGTQTALKRALFEGSFLAHVLPFSLFQPGPRPDLVLGVVPSLGGGVAAVAAARRYRAPLGLLYHDLVGQAALQTGMPGGRRVAGATQRIERWLARRATGIAVVSDGFRPYLEGFGVEPDRIVQIRQWAHIRPPDAPRAETRRRLGWHPETQVVLHAGNMGLKQGLENVVQAARLAAQTRPHLRFVLLGDGNQRAALESLAAGCPSVVFHDPVPTADFPNVLAAADVLLVNERASLRDMCLPSKLTSYFVAGRPVVGAVGPGGATDRELLRSGAGLTVPAEQPEALLEALLRLAAEPDLMARLAEAGPRYAAEHLSAEAVLARAEQFTSDLMDWHAATRAPAAEGALR